MLKCVQVQTTSVCNGQCIICPYSESWFVKNPGYMSDELYTKILDDIAEYDPIFFGKFCPYLCNDPFADADIIKRTDLARQKLANPYLEVSTNLVLATRNQIDDLIRIYERNRFNGRIMVSFHGINEESYRKTMGLSYKKAMDNAVYLIGQLDGRMPIYVHCAAESRDGSYPLTKKEDSFTFWKDVVVMRNLTAKNLHVFPLKFHTRAGNVNLDGWDYKKIVRDIGPDNRFDCPRIHDHLHVIYTGEVIGCCCDYQHEVVLGDLTKQSIKEVFDSDKWKSWTKMVTGEIESPPDFLCKRCSHVGG